MSDAQFDFVAGQESLRTRLAERLNESGITLQSVADLDPHLKRGWVGRFSRGDIPTASLKKLQALKRALDRLDQIKAFEASMIASAQSSCATA